MRICQINGGAFGSTGKIMFKIVEKAKGIGINTLCFAPVTSTNRFKEPEYEYIKIGNYRTRQLNVLLARLTGFNGCFAPFATLKVLKKIKRFSPDIIHLHNLHDSYINLPMLFNFIKKQNIQAVFTLHDCWAFTGNCVHYDIVQCQKWKSMCYSCPNKKEYPKTYLDTSKIMYKLKKKWFYGLKNPIIITPSNWLYGEVKQSYLKDFDIRYIANGIDLNVFKPIKSDFSKKYGLEDKKIVLGVSFGWNYRKGLDVFIELSKRLGDEYKIVLVGTDAETDEKLPKNILSIHRTQNQKELAEIYTAADVLANPTREEMFGLVNVEALACGTPVVTFNSGGSPACIDESCGVVVPADNIDAMQREIEKICSEKPFSKEACIKRSKEFDADEKYAETVKLYLDLFSKK